MLGVCAFALATDVPTGAAPDVPAGSAAPAPSGDGAGCPWCDSGDSPTGGCSGFGAGVSGVVSCPSVLGDGGLSGAGSGEPGDPDVGSSAGAVLSAPEPSDAATAEATRVPLRDVPLAMAPAGLEAGSSESWHVTATSSAPRLSAYGQLRAITPSAALAAGTGSPSIPKRTGRGSASTSSSERSSENSARGSQASSAGTGNAPRHTRSRAAAARDVHDRSGEKSCAPHGRSINSRERGGSA